MAGWPTVGDVRTRLGISDASEDVRLGQILNGSIAWIQAYCSWHISPTIEVTKQYDLDGPDYNPRTRFLSFIEPFTRIQRVRVATYRGGLSNADELSGADPQDYHADTQLTWIGTVAIGIRLHRAYERTHDFLVVTGWYGSSVVPDGIIEACMRLVFWEYRRETSGQAVRVSREGGGSLNSEAVPDDILILINPYRRHI